VLSNVELNMLYSAIDVLASDLEKTSSFYKKEQRGWYFLCWIPFIL